MAYFTFAAIDVGSSDLSLKIYEISPKVGIRQLDYVRYIIELGSETYNNGKISFTLVDEMCEVLLGFKLKLEEYRVKDYMAYGTSAIREASNNEIILDQIQLRTGFIIKILSNSEERFMMYKALAAQKTDFNKIIQKNTAILDIGAGSVQISLFDKQMLTVTQNIRIGSVRLRDILGDMKQKTVNYNALIEEYVGNEIDTFRNLFLKEKDIKNVIAMGDEIINIIKTVPELNITETISRGQFDLIYEKLTTMTSHQLSMEYGLPYETTTLLLPSAIIYKKFLDESKAELLWTTDVDLCDGIAAAYADETKKLALEHNFNDDILVAARNIAKRFKCNRVHVQNVTDIALGIFDHIKKIHGLNKRERILLEIAINLHDCGKYVNMNNGAENSYLIIMSTEIIGLSHKEREEIANMVKFNTLDLPAYENMDNKLTVEEYRKVAKLSAILRISNAMDRSHKQKINKFVIALKGNELIITADTIEDIALERGLFDSKADFFEEIFGIRPILKQRRSV